MKKRIFTGAATAIITPMKNDGTPDFDELTKLVEFQINQGIDALVACGTTGEASSLDDSEHLAVINCVVNAAKKRVPVIAGAGSNDTRHAIKLSVAAQALGVDALLHVTPYYNKTNQSGLISHFTAIADNVNLPIILYNVPSRTGMTISPSTYLELSKHKNIVATKEASGNISAIAKTAALCGDNLAIYSGNDDQIIPLLSLGGIGVISVLSNVMPKETHEICRKYFDGNLKESLSLQLKLLNFIEVLFIDVNPIPVKEAMNIFGYNAGKCRLPLGELSAGHKSVLAAEMKALELIK